MMEKLVTCEYGFSFMHTIQSNKYLVQLTLGLNFKSIKLLNICFLKLITFNLCVYLLSLDSIYNLLKALSILFLLSSPISHYIYSKVKCFFNSS